MLPNKNNINNISIITMPSKTYKIDFDKNIARGLFNEIKSLTQAIYKILITKRYKYEIYDWNYGIEIDDLIGMPKEYVKIEIERRIKDALSIDDRILDVYDFEFFDVYNDRCSLCTNFIVKSIFGDFNFSLEV
ncbi:DUF2634 domain-containing protein [uncultured Tyzzerella sp.]|uniref:DUF2634 domain-containing protein n=1 Tax=uncultured Tyzzerella sp. TaxID=2321398 RepID=UPI002942D64F|nr:DUF2634 domain-containing protein [uncultured Tyzzerella sp.]